MSEYDEMMRTFAAAGAAELKPLITEAAAALQLEGESVEQLGEYLAKAWMDGAMAGQDSMLKQAEEAGFIVENRMVRAPPVDDAADS